LTFLAQSIGTVPDRSEIETLNSLVTRSLVGRTVQLGIATTLAFVTILAWRDEGAPFYLLAVLIPAIGLLPLPGRSASGPVWRWIHFCLGAAVLTRAIFFGEDRYHLVVTPLLCLLAAAALREAVPQAAGPTAALAEPARISIPP